MSARSGPAEAHEARATTAIFLTLAPFLAVLYIGGAVLVAGGLEWIWLADNSLPSRMAAIGLGVLMLCIGAWFSLVLVPLATRAKERSR